MDSKKVELIALLNAISEVAERLCVSQGDKSYSNAAKVAKRLAELEKTGLSEDTIITILHIEGYIDDNELSSLIKI